MARIRSLKPGFFIDSDLATLPPMHRLAFQGLWCHADKAGRLEDKPRELKVQILPYDSCDFNRILSDLALPKGRGPGFIRRYELNGRHYISVTHFLDHQRPHHKEVESEIPEPPPWSMAEALTASPGKDGAGTVPTPSEPAGFLVLGAGAVSGDGKVSPPPTQVERPPPGFTVVPPTTPPEEWTGDDFWRWAQSVRAKARNPPEKKPRAPLSSWWSGCLMQEGITPRALQAGFLKFGQSDFWEAKDPPFPFHGFMSQWEQFTRMEAPDEAHAS